MPQPLYTAGWNESARAIAQASWKRGSMVPSINSPGRSEGYSLAYDKVSFVEDRCEKCTGRNCRGCSSPAAAINSDSACRVA